MASLIYSNGAFNWREIAAEIELRLADMVASWTAKGYDAEWIARQRASYLPTVTEWVEREARIERHDIFERTMASLTTAAERARIAELCGLGHAQPISADGNLAAKGFWGEADRITREIRARAEAHFENLSNEVRAAAQRRASAN